MQLHYIHRSREWQAIYHTFFVVLLMMNTERSRGHQLIYIGGNFHEIAFFVLERDQPHLPLRVHVQL